MKGITPIIAIIILLIISITIAGFAYSYMSGYFSGITSKVVQLKDFYGNSIVLANIGSQPVDISTDIFFLTNGKDAVLLNTPVIQPGESATIEFVPAAGEFKNGIDVRIRAPGNVITLTTDVQAIQGTCTNNDLDGYAFEGGVCGTQDCNDNNITINPEAPEICDDLVDNDCDSNIDEGCGPVCTDADMDAFNVTGVGCGLADCNDTNSSIYPGAPEICDGVDNQCPGDGGYGTVDEGCPTCTDIDLDGFGNPGSAVCPAGPQLDCNDSNSTINSNATEICDDLVDNNCNSLSDCSDFACNSHSSCTGPGYLSYGLVAHYRFEGNANDSSANGFNGTLNGNAGFASGFLGQGLDLDGSGDYVEIPHNSLFNMGTGNYTITAFVKPRNLSASAPFSEYSLLSKILNATNFFYFRFRDINGVMLSLQISGTSYVAGGSAVTTDNFDNDKWHMATFVIDRSIDSMVVYYNTTAEGGPQTFLPSAIGVPISNVGPVRIGQLASTNYFNGTIDELRVYNRALNSTEISALFSLAAG